MVPLLDLWLPTLLSAVFVFVVSSVVHMVVQWHKNDMKKLPQEDQILATLRSHGLSAGMYMFPACGSMKDMGTPEMQAKLKQGPIGHLTLRPAGGFSMGPSLAQWFVLSLFISACAGYVAGMVLGPGADTTTVFRLTATAALLGYACSTLQDSIWKAVPWSTSAKFVFDGLLYALATGGTFAWMWPAAAYV